MSARDPGASHGAAPPRTLLVWLSLGLLVAVPAAAEQRSLSMEEAVQLALQRNPDVRSEEAEVQAARARLSGASLLLQSNPEVDVAAGPRRRDGNSSIDYTVQLSQRIEVSGQRGARVEAASGALGAAEARLGTRRAEVAAEVREAFGQALAAAQLVTLAEDAVRLAEQTLETARRRLEAGDASRIELNAAQVEVGRARREVRRTIQNRAVALGELQRLLALDAETTLDLRGELATSAPDKGVDVEALVRTALQQHPGVRMARQEAEASRAEARLASREALPAPRLGASYSREEDAHILQATLGVELPLFNRNQAARGVSAARVTQAEAALEAAGRRVEREARLAAARLAAAQAAVGDFAGGVLPAAQENLELLQAAYTAGKVDILQLLLIRRDTLETRRGYVEALADLNSAQAQLAQAIGSEQEVPR
ncbi:TolC family protein [Myxococcus sp. AB056]|uniref:TolC family protein n=1 Tax=Myxococcus sp. AB056 TaxID=2562792 RepID=UPI001146AEB4|nr:TolC family protein [Myxococcus sp. AB056]